MTRWRFDDAGWVDRRKASAGLLIAATTFGILALELALIRWTSSQIRVFAYFNNLVLIGAFLGMGLGVALGRRQPGLVHWVLPALVVIAVPLAFSEQLGLVHLAFPDRSVSLWGGTDVEVDLNVFARNLGIFLSVFTAIVGLFVCAAAPLGFLFTRLPVLRAYSADLAGSLLGIIAFALASWFQAGPAAWLALGALPFVWLARSYLALGFAVVAVGLAQFSARDALFSPYNRIELLPNPLGLEMQVNRDFHQYLFDFSPGRFADPQLPAALGETLTQVRDLYHLPFVLNPQRRSALIVGAGTGNDVQAARRNGYARVTSVDIDARILAIGAALHPEKPYAQPGVRQVIDDARSYFSKERETKFDVVCFGLLDSHAMNSAMSTLRLDNYVYTEEGIRAAWQRVAPGGHLSLAISCNAGRWFFERLFWTVTRATGSEPIAFYSPLHGGTVTFVVPDPAAGLDAQEVAKRPRIRPEAPRESVATTSDDWPFLYLRPDTFAWGYVVVLAFVLGLAAVTVSMAFGLGRSGAGLDWPLFLMGAAFLLLETRGITSMSLLFGSTWVVNAVIFGGILVMVLLANLAVERWGLRDPRGWFWGLFVAMAVLYAFPIAWLQTLPFGGRALLAGLLTGLPVGFAGVIVPMLLARSPQPAVALGSNLLGAVLGGCLEYYSMLGGLKSTAILALVLYLLAYLLVQKRVAAAVTSAAPVTAAAAG